MKIALVVLFAGMSVTAAPPQAPLNLAQALPTGARIEVQQQGVWTRGDVSEDEGPQAKTIKVRVGPNAIFVIVPRNSIRLAPRPAAIHIGDRLELYDTSTFSYFAATVSKIGEGSMTGYYWMTGERWTTGTYAKPENLWLLPGRPAAGGAPSQVVVDGPLPGKYRCFAYGAVGNPPIFLGGIDLKATGSYTATMGKEGRYSFDAATKTITWASGWMKSNTFGGKLESNALFRIAPTSICSHE